MEEQSIVVTNNEQRCCIHIKVECPLEELGDITQLKLRRTSDASSNEKILIQKEVSDVAELSFEYDDLETVCGVTYTYYIIMSDEEDMAVRSGFASAKCQFSGICIADEDTSWKTAFGTSANQYSEAYKRTRQVQYVTTLSGKFPHRVSNSAANYTTGSCTGWWIPLGGRCSEPVITGNADLYRDAFIDFLANGKDKLLRTSNGKAMIVSIDGEIQENWNPRTELTTVTFSWTQIGEIDRPTYTNPNPGWTREEVTL